MQRKKITATGKTREENPVVFMDIKSLENENRNEEILGRLHFELRSDLVPIACNNFLMLITGSKGIGIDGINYHYKGTKIHRVVRDIVFQGGDILGQNGNYSRSAYGTEGVFDDENFVLRHCGAGTLSMCNRGPNTNGSIFQVIFNENCDMDNRYVVFGSLVGEESFAVLQRINALGSYWGATEADIVIYDCGVIFPKPPT